tara:strand:- start:1122 stop:1691 length:570 start_codon:yes stop_codon:yes gene_type:complete
MNLKSAHTGKIGKAFTNARILRSMTQEEVVGLTLINIDYIKAIESGDYAAFPARIFAVQYFNKYAKFLNLDINFFDIYNTKVVQAADEALATDLSKRSFLNKSKIYFFFICLVFLISLIFIFQDNNIDEVTEVILNEASANVEDLKMEIQSNFKNDVNGLHDEINNFFIQYKLDSIQLDVNVDSSEQDA